MKLSKTQFDTLRNKLTRVAPSTDLDAVISAVEEWLDRLPTNDRAVAQACPHGFMGVCGYCLSAAGKIPEVKLPDRSRFKPE